MMTKTTRLFWISCAASALCLGAQAQDSVTLPLGANTEAANTAAVDAPEGFLISIDGAPVSGDRRMADIVRRTDIALANANVQVSFDGLGAKPALDLDVQTGPRHPRAGDTLTVQSRLNYAPWITRSEVRVLDQRSGRTLLVTPVPAGGQAQLTLPEGDALVLVHRVYDARGRYDETAPLTLGDRGQGAETGSDRTARRRIPVSGGAVTVSGSGVRPGASVQVMGETVTPSADGAFVLQRILPVGDHSVPVRVQGAGEDLFVQRDITIPRAEWFTVAVADLTFGRNFGTNTAQKTYSKGRLSFYAKGKTASGWTITSSADTREEDLDQLFRNLDRKDPRSLLLRFDNDASYPVFGDDSTIAEDAPTSGKFYFKAEKNGNHLVWGNYKSEITGTKYLRNERTLYGAQGVYRSADTTAQGDARVSASLYAAQPDNLPGRDVFRGTGGSVYFLQRQDLSTGSETVTIEVRDPDTGRVLERRSLAYGRDYDINYLQGLVVLSDPLTGSVSGGLISESGGQPVVNLVVQYEYTPVAGNLDGYAYGGRVEGWVTDRLRIGATGMVEQTDIADQTATGVDFRYQFDESTFVDLEYARTDGPGFGSGFSADGGLIVTNTAAAGGTGEAFSVAGQADLRTLGLGVDGTISAYAERRTAGFSTLDYQVTTTEELWGFDARVQPSERLSYRVYWDDFSDYSGKKRREGGVEASFAASDRATWAFGVETLDKATPGDPTETGQRTDVAAKLTVAQSDALTWHLFAQGTVARNGGLDRNDRYGAGVNLAFAKHWQFEGQISDGTKGVGGRLLFSHEDAAGNTTYLGYDLEPGRELSGVTLSGSDQGRIIAGGTRAVSDAVDVYGENSYDLFGTHKSLTSTYGVNYRRSDRLAYSASIELGQIDDPLGDFDRTALSFGLRYQDEAGLTARAKLEYRKDRGVLNGTIRDGDTLVLAASARYQMSDAGRLLFAFDSALTDTDQSALKDGEYVEASLGYAYRPVLDDKLNVLLKYTYLYDMYGQQINGTATPGPRQESHVLSADLTYDVNRHWSLGGKLGARLSRSSPDGIIPLAQNDAWLAVLNARYHLVHNWDVLVEARHLNATDAGFSETGLLGAVYRHMGNNLKLGLGYNFSSFSDDLTDLTQDDKGVFVNLIAKF